MWGFLLSMLWCADWAFAALAPFIAIASIGLFPQNVIQLDINSNDVSSETVWMPNGYNATICHKLKSRSSHTIHEKRLLPKYVTANSTYYLTR